MSRITKRFTQHEYAQLYMYIQSQSTDGAILMRPGELAEKATEALGFPVPMKKVSTTAQDAGIELIRNSPRKHVEQNDLDENAVHQKLAAIEDKLDALLKAWDVKCGRLL